MKRVLLTIFGCLLLVPLSAGAQNSSLWKFIGNLRPVVSSWRVDAPGGLSGSVFTLSGSPNCASLQTSAIGLVSCGAAGGGGTGTGALQNFFDNRWVNTSGDTMTGTLVINLTTGTVGLEVIQIMSGTHIHAQDLLTSSGNLIVEGTGYFPNLLTGSKLKASESLTSSGTLVVEGLTTLNGSVVISEGALSDSTITEAEFKAVDVAADEEILTFETTTGDFEWETCADITGSADLCDGSDASGAGSAGQGITVAGSVISLTAAHSGTTIEATTLLSGAAIHAQNRLSSSGGVIALDGIETGDATLWLNADEGDDTADRFGISFLAANSLSFISNATEVMNLTTAGTLQLDAELTVSGGDITGANAASVDAGENTSGDWTWVGDHIVADNAFYGLSSATGRMEIDDQTIDEFNFLNAAVGIQTSTPKTALDVVGTVSGSLITTSTPSGANYIRGNLAVGALTTSEALEIIGRGSGRILHAQDLISASGGLITLQAGEGSSADFVIQADEGDDATDSWTIRALAGDGGLYFRNNASNDIAFGSDGAAAFSGAIIGATTISGATIFDGGNQVSAIKCATLEVSGSGTALTSSGKYIVAFNSVFSGSIVKVDAWHGESGNGATTYDVNINTTTVLSTKLTVDANEKCSTASGNCTDNAATAAVISANKFTQGSDINVDVDRVSGSTKPKNMRVRVCALPDFDGYAPY